MDSNKGKKGKDLMIKSLIKSTNEVRLESEEEADIFHKQVQEEAAKLGCTLTNFNKTLKEKKSQGEIIESWYIVKYTLTFNDPKDPQSLLSSIDYNLINGEC